MVGCLHDGGMVFHLIHWSIFLISSLEWISLSMVGWISQWRDNFPRIGDVSFCYGEMPTWWWDGFLLITLVDFCFFLPRMNLLVNGGLALSMVGWFSQNWRGLILLWWDAYMMVGWFSTNNKSRFLMVGWLSQWWDDFPPIVMVSWCNGGMKTQMVGQTTLNFPLLS